MRNRLVLAALASCLLLASAGCKSNNADGRLVGRWQCTVFPGVAASGVTEYWVFGADHSFQMIVQTAVHSKVINGTYRTSWGDQVYMENLSEAIGGYKILKSDLIVNGNQLTVRDTNGTTLNFTRVPGQ